MNTNTYKWELKDGVGECSQRVDLGNDLIFYCDKANKPGRLYITGIIEFHEGHDFPK